MAKATTTIRQSLNYPAQYAHYFVENAALFNRVVAFYFACIQAHEGLLALSNKQALTALEKLTHATAGNPHPSLPLFTLAPDIPAMFRRAAINASLGSARSFFSSLKKWRLRREKYEAKQSRTGKKKRPWRRAATGSPAYLEQVGSLLRWPLERAQRIIHHAQGLDRLMLVMAQGAHALTRSPQWLRSGQSFSGAQGGEVLAAWCLKI
jgi:hypothetical protein